MSEKLPWWKRASVWIVKKFAEHIFLQILFAFPSSYLMSLLVQMWAGKSIVFDLIPPVFWPILSVMLCGVLFYPAFVVPIRAWWRSPSYESVKLDEAYDFFEHVIDAYLGDAHELAPVYAMRAQERIDRMMPFLRKLAKRHSVQVPNELMEGWNQDSVSEWRKFMRELRTRIQ